MDEIDEIKDWEAMDDEFEDWEPIAEFTDQEDWEGLVKWTKNRFDKNPKEHYYQYQYADALIQNKEYEKAIEVLTEAYKLHFESGDIIHCLLEALFKSGKTEKDFEWKETPAILGLDNITIQLCEDFLKGKRKHTSLSDIYCDLVIGGYYLKFTEEELHDFLIDSERFDILPDIINSKFKNRKK